ncbi:MAG TPA: sulfotransferase domain-containing protein [Sandaracinaceae bacterium LLY-WYZ-13_1]|nr:sulfotransferase domain-containing protein [Sandaracinaceae bacterium LLY-WYZ-13_1]
MSDCPYPFRTDADSDRKRLIFVMGVQRSGTNALRRSLSLSPSIVAFNEAKEDELYDDWFLRPEPEIRDLLKAVPLPVLLKPISETLERSLSEVMEEFAAYDLHVVWIYRDPVNVYHSTVTRWPHKKDVGTFIEQWNARNLGAAEAMDRYGEQITVVRYRDLVKDYLVFRNLCERLGIRQGENLFSRDSRAGYEHQPEEVQQEILSETASAWTKMESLRAFRPRRRTLADPEPTRAEKLRAKVDDLEAELATLDPTLSALRAENDDLRRRLETLERSGLRKLEVATRRGIRALRGK